MLAKIDLTLSLCKERGIALAAHDRTPIFFVPCGTAKRAFAAAERLRACGIYACVSVFPAVPEKAAGIRFTISLHNDEQDIDRLVGALAQQAQIAA